MYIILAQITAIETLRAALKAYVLMASGERHLLTGGQVHKPVVTVTSAEQGGPKVATVSPPLSNTGCVWSKGARSGVCVPTPAALSPVPGPLDAAAHSVRVAGEALHIARSLLYLAVRCVRLRVRLCV